MASRVNIFHLSTGWNGVYPDPDTDVSSELGTFTWRSEGSDLPLPANSTPLVEINLDDSKLAEVTIALHIMKFVSQPRNNAVAIDVASELMKKIARARMMSELAHV